MLGGLLAVGLLIVLVGGYGRPVLGNPAEVDNYAPNCAKPMACGEICFWADCVHCSLGVGTRLCNPQTTVDGDGNVVYDPPVSYQDPAQNGLLDFHSRYAGQRGVDHEPHSTPSPVDMTYERPALPPDDPCVFVGENVQILYFYDVPPCAIWHYHMAGGDESHQYENYIPHSADNPTNLMTALEQAGTPVADLYHCRSSRTGVDAVVPTRTSNLPARTPSATDFGTPNPTGDSAPAGFTGQRTVDFVGGLGFGGEDFGPLGSAPWSFVGDAGAPILNSVVETGQGGQVQWKFSGYHGRTIYYRYWQDYGEFPSPLAVNYEEMMGNVGGVWDMTLTASGGRHQALGRVCLPTGRRKPQLG